MFLPIENRGIAAQPAQFRTVAANRAFFCSYAKRPFAFAFQE
jgi:hypothetical protein